MTQLNTTNPFALRYLMDDTIFDFEVGSAPEGVQASDPMPLFNFMGMNKSHILYLIENVDENYFSPSALDAFTKTLHALQLSVDDVAVLNLAQIERKVNFEEIVSFFTPQKVIFAGPAPVNMGLTGQEINRASTQKAIRLLYTYSFEEMLTDTNKKKAFWQAVKAL